MNERIFELAQQAENYSTTRHPVSNIALSVNNEKFVKKFAELIVRECAEVCKKQEYDYWRSSEDQDFTPQDCADAIEQHFGVEE